MPSPPPPDAADSASIALAKTLIGCRSITPDDDGAVAIVAERLTRAGFACERIDREGVANLWATHGSGTPLVCFAGHVDVVPAGAIEQWTSDPFAAIERNGQLYGRGAADMKASVAAMVTAAERLAATAPASRGSLAVLLTSDEEGDALHGTRAVVQTLTARNIAIDAAIVGEPTSDERFGDTIKIGRRGSLSGALTVHGVQCHIAYPERGDNPIHRALPALTELTATAWDSGGDGFPPTSFQISSVQAGAGAVNVVPAAMQVLFNFRFAPASTIEDLKRRVHDVLDRRSLNYTLEWTLNAEPFSSRVDGRLVNAMSRAVHTVTGTTPQLSTSGGTSDGRFLATIAREVIEFGPLNRTIHKVNEHVAVADIGRLSAIYEHAARELLAGT
jgi:succinyl-diaminopimelate desuccinylase